MMRRCLTLWCPSEPVYFDQSYIFKSRSVFSTLIGDDTDQSARLPRRHRLISLLSGPEVIKIFMLNSAEHEIFPAHRC